MTSLNFSRNSIGVALLAAAVFLCGAARADDAGQSLPLESLRTFTEVFGVIKDEYVDATDDAALLQDAIRGMLDGLDPHSIFLSPDEYADMRETAEGEFGGLGIELTTEDGNIRVIAPIDDTPAADAGLRTGDLIVKLDGAPVHGKNINRIVGDMRGEPGTPVTLTIARVGENEFDVTLVRAIIRVVSVRGEMLPNDFAYLRVSSFQSRTAKQLEKKIRQLETEHDAKIRGWVLDLRNNPGGVLHAAIDVADLFLPAGVIVSTRERHNKNQRRFTAAPGDLLRDAPMAVVVNGGSASASEIVAGALQDHARAVIVGTETFGKGSVQSILPLNNDAALKLTTALYYTPHGRSIQATGIRPDIAVEQIDMPAPLASDGAARETDILGHRENADPTESDAAQQSAAQKSKLLARDYQLREALNVLKGMSLYQRRAEARATNH